MKKIIAIFMAISLIFPMSASAEGISIDQLKDKVASRVAELKLVEKRGIVGVVTEIKGNEITINDIKGNTRFIDVDELTKYSSEDDPSFGLESIKKGSKISALGIYNKESERLLSRFLNEVSLPVFLNGVITDKDVKNFTITLSTEDQNPYLVDIENITKVYSFSDGKLETDGFSKIKTMENAIVVGYPDPKQKDRISATRIITFPGGPKNPKVEISKKSPSISVTPTNKNGK